MRIKSLKTYYLKHAETILDKKEGGRRLAFSQTAIPITANVYDDDQKLVPMMQGIKSTVQKVMLFSPDEVVCLQDAETGQERYTFCLEDGSSHYITAGDGVCVYVAPETNPDYRIYSVVLCGGHLECVLERIYGRT